MLKSRHRNTERNHNLLTANISFENIAKCKHLGTTKTNKNFFHEEIKRELNSENACYHYLPNILFFRLLSKNLKIKMYRTIILPVVLYGCVT
jgi:hypothetical protein